MEPSPTGLSRIIQPLRAGGRWTGGSGEVISARYRQACQRESVAEVRRHLREGRPLSRITIPPLVKRLATREYLPLSLWLATWVLLGLHLGHADAVRLLAANAFLTAARSIAALEAMQVLASRTGTAKAVRRASKHLAWRIDLTSLGGTILLLAGLIALLWWRGMEEPAIMVAIVALGLPARHPGALLVAWRDRAMSWKLGAGVSGLAGAALVFALGGGIVGAALALAARDWGGLIATALFGPRRRAKDNLPEEPLTFAEVASRTEASSRRRLTYRIGKSALVAMFGPFGNIIARTGRGARLDRKVARFVPRHRGSMALLAFGTFTASLVLLVVSREPAALLGSAALARIAASAGSALLWWSYARAVVDEEDDEED